MKHAGLIATILIVGFWILMNTKLVLREAELNRLDRYQRGVNDFLGSSLKKERWMSIYQGPKKIGYTGFTLEKVHSVEAVEYHAFLDTLWRGELPLPKLFASLLGKSPELRIFGEFILDDEMKPLRLNLTLRLGSAEAEVVGRRDGTKFSVDLLLGKQKKATVPLDLQKWVLSDGLTPTITLAGCQVGDTYRLPVFDPITSFFPGGAKRAVVEVVGRETKRVDGILIDVFLLQTEFRGIVSRSWVTESGEVLRQELGPPLALILRKEASRRAAKKGFDTQ